MGEVDAVDAFMNEPVTIMAGNKDEREFIELHLKVGTPDHETKFIQAETVTTVPRKWAELLARGKVLPMTIIRDDNPRGREWWQKAFGDQVSAVTRINTK